MAKDQNGPEWKASLQHLKVGLERMTKNYSAHSDVTWEEAIVIAESVLQQLKTRAKRARKRPKKD